ncbi:NmrA family NAD(P)-binding protein [Leekyejoonella antrihumi]|nr:NmrA family NAD(P)-binding protein [Leekyejoonella antrihumi]
MKVLATGATGYFAHHIVPALAAHGVEVRALVHDPAKTDRALRGGAIETVVADLRDPDSLDAALDGVDGLFLILPAFAPDTVALGTGAVATAAARGVRRVVYSGVYHPSLSLANHADTRPVEEALYHSGMEFTVLQPAMYLQGLTGSWPAAVDTGIYAAPWSRRAAMTYVDFRDVAEVAAHAFARDDLVGGTFELATGTYTREQIAVAMSRHAGRPVEPVDLPPLRAVDAMPPGPQRDGLAAMFTDYDTHGFHGGNDVVLRTLLGRPPRTLEQFIAELAGDQPMERQR